MNIIVRICACAAALLLPLLPLPAGGGVVPPSPPVPMPAELGELQLAGIFLIPVDSYKKLTGKDVIYRVYADIRLVNRSRRAIQVEHQYDQTWCGPLTLTVTPEGGQALQAEPVPLGDNAPQRVTTRLRRGKTLKLTHLSPHYDFADMQTRYDIHIEGSILIDGRTYAYRFDERIWPKDAVTSFEELNAARKRRRE